MDVLMTRRKTILKNKKLSLDEVMEVEIIEKEISDEIANKEYKKLEEVLGELNTDTHTNIWKEMKKAFPAKQTPLPTGVKNIQGKLITNPKEKKRVTLKHFEHHMRKRAIKDEIVHIRKLQEKLFNERLKKSKEDKSAPFDMYELD